MSTPYFYARDETLAALLLIWNGIPAEARSELLATASAQSKAPDVGG